MKKVFVFEDDNNLRSLIIKLIKREYGSLEILDYEDPSFCSIFSSDSKECSCSPDNPCADIIITDINMINVNGIDFIKGLKCFGCKVKDVLFISGDIGNDEIDYILDNGFYYLHKPFSISDFYNTLNRMI